jgi:O-acetyl-ADP-ribose deacetylase (regulator of RNase III)
MTRIHIEQGDLTGYRVDAIVNAANNDLILGGGLAGAIRRVGGPSIQDECDTLGPIPLGDAAVTSAGNLPCRYVIHQASMRLGGKTSSETLESSTRAALRLAEERRITSVAFPAVGTGIAGFPVRDCAEIMLREVLRHLQGPTDLKDVYFVLFDSNTATIFREVHDEFTQNA